MCSSTIETLYLCEKPSQARALAKVLGASQKSNGAYFGDGVAVTYCYGSMLNLANPDHYLHDSLWRIEDLPVLPKNWEAVVRPSVREQYTRIGELLKMSARAVIATDPDDAGEVIGRMVIAAHKFSGEVKRLWASALDRNSLASGLKNLRNLSETEAYYRAGLLRYKLDWLFGMNLTRAFSLKLGTTAKIGRVKTRLLVELVKQEDAIRSFFPQETYVPSFTLKGARFDWNSGAEGKLPAFGSAAKCLSISNDVVELPPPQPFTLSALLVAIANNGYSLEQAYQATQSLYDQGFISYPRTSCDKLPDGNTVGFANHHAIVPVMSGGALLGFNEVERAVYQAIEQNYNMNLLGQAYLNRQMISMSINGQIFNHTNLWLGNDEDAGWLLMSNSDLALYYGKKPATGFTIGAAYPALPESRTIISAMPQRYTEATLLDMMMKNNIGTEATRVSAISSLVEDGVATMEGGVVSATDQGKGLISMLPAAVVGNDMSDMVRNAVLDARLSANTDRHLIDATQWLASIIHDSMAVA